MPYVGGFSRTLWRRTRSSLRLPRGERRWLVLALFIAIPTTVALTIIIASALERQDEVWQHLAEYRLRGVLVNTAWLVLGVGFGTTLIGTSLGWLTAVCDFPGRRFFSWALLLPMAIPGYVMGFVAIGLLEYAGPVQSLLREWLGSSRWFPEIRSRGGIIFVMTLTLYPYVYLLARNAFLTQGRRAVEVSRSLGFAPWRGFWRASLPLARPWIASGTILVAMETLADFGTVAVFNYDTFTVIIYEAWFHLFSLSSALRLALVLVLVVLLIVLIERQLRARTQYTAADAHAATAQPLALRGWRAGVATACAGSVLTIAFIAPFIQLIVWGSDRLSDADARLFGFALRSIVLALTGAVVIASVALALSYAVRNSPRPATRLIARIATLGYALPGTVLAVSIFAPIAYLNNVTQRLLDAVFEAAAPQLLLQATIITMLIAYLARFLAVAHGPIDSSMLRITRSVDEASRGLGVSGWTMLRRVHAPMLRTGLLTGLTLVFVDIMKEMPITLMTRPFGWDTLAVRVFEMTSEGEWQRAALPSILIVLTGLIPVAVITRRMDHAARAR